jgi:hypothetical protein
MTMPSSSGSSSPRRGNQSTILGPFDTDDGGTTILRNAGNCLPVVDTAWRPGTFKHFRCKNLKSCMSASCYLLVDWQSDFNGNSVGMWRRLKGKLKPPCYLSLCCGFWLLNQLTDIHEILYKCSATGCCRNFIHFSYLKSYNFLVKQCYRPADLRVGTDTSAI